MGYRSERSGNIARGPLHEYGLIKGSLRRDGAGCSLGSREAESREAATREGYVTVGIRRPTRWVLFLSQGDRWRTHLGSTDKPLDRTKIGRHKKIRHIALLYTDLHFARIEECIIET